MDQTKRPPSPITVLNCPTWNYNYQECSPETSVQTVIKSTEAVAETIHFHFFITELSFGRTCCIFRGVRGRAVSAIHGGMAHVRFKICVTFRIVIWTGIESIEDYWSSDLILLDFFKDIKNSDDQQKGSNNCLFI